MYTTIGYMSVNERNGNKTVYNEYGTHQASSTPPPPIGTLMITYNAVIAIAIDTHDEH
jgi:hypothetical protein